MTIYKSAAGKKKILELYDKQLERLGTAYSDKWVSASFGETHLIETENPSGIKNAPMINSISMMFPMAVTEENI